MRTNKLTRTHIACALIAGLIVGSTAGLWAGITLRIDDPIRISGPDHYPRVVRLPEVDK